MADSCIIWRLNNTEKKYKYLYIEISVNKWSGYSYWKSSTAIDSVISNMVVGLSMSDYYNIYLLY